MTRIGIEDFKKRYSDGQVKLLIDVRTPAEFEEVHVKNAVNLPLGDLNLQKVEELFAKAAASEVYLICRSGGRSMQALEKLDSLGFKHAVSIDGGTGAAEICGLPIEKSGRKVISLERQVRIAAGLLVFFGTLAGILISSYFLAIPLLVGAGLVYAAITNSCGMGLLLSKCPWNDSSCGCSN